MNTNLSNDALAIIRKYVISHHGDLTTEYKQQVIDALGALMPSYATETKQTALMNAPHESLHEICTSKLQALRILDHEDTIKKCLALQTEHQEIMVAAHDVIKNKQLYAHTAADTMRKYRGLWSKLQLMWSDYTNYVSPNPAIQSAQAKFGNVIQASVYQPERIAPDIIDFALHGKTKQRYTPHEHEKLIHLIATDIDSIKAMCKAAIPLEYKNNDTRKTISDSIPVEPQSTDRIVKLVHPQHHTVRYLITEHTDTYSSEKQYRRYIIPTIRYKLIADKTALLNYLQQQLPKINEKITLYTGLEQKMQMIGSPRECYTGMVVSNDGEIHGGSAGSFQDDLIQIDQQITGFSRNEIKWRQQFAGLQWKNKSSDQTIFIALKNTLTACANEQRKIMKHTTLQIQGLHDDPEF